MTAERPPSSLSDNRRECVELDGCCATHGPCFEPEKPGVPHVSCCQGWPCPASGSGLTRAENHALTVALNAIERDELPTGYVASVCVTALARLVGRPVFGIDPTGGSTPIPTSATGSNANSPTSSDAGE